MRERLDDGRRHLRHTCLGVVAVVEVASRPGSVEEAHVAHLTRQHLVGEVVGCDAADAGTQAAVVEVGGADGQRTIDALAVGVEACIAVYGQRQLERNTLSRHVRHIRRAASQPVCHERAHVDVVAVVVLAVLRAIGSIGSSCPLGIVASTLERARHSAGGTAACDVSHSAAEANGIGRHHTSVIAEVRQLHTVELAVSLVELKGAEIDPCASTHLLVHAEHRLLAFVAHHILRVGHAVAERLIAHVDGISSLFREAWRVGDGACLLRLARCLRHPGGASLEGILAVVINTAVEGKTRLRSIDPVVLNSMFEIVIGSGVVVVDDDLMSLPVAFARCEDDGARILEHRDEVGHDDGLCEQVLGGAEKIRSLPLPESFLLVVVASVACPDAQMPVVQAV